MELNVYFVDRQSWKCRLIETEILNGHLNSKGETVGLFPEFIW